jgi:hypothetical protein
VLGHRRVNHCDVASGAGATIGAAAASPAADIRAAQSANDVAEGQRLVAGEDNRSSDDAPPRQRGAAGRWTVGRWIIDCLSEIGA